MLKKSLIALLSIMMVLSLGLGVVFAESYKVGVVSKSLGDPFQLTLIDSAKKKGAELGIDVLGDAPPREANIAQQIAIVEDMLSKNVDALAISPVNAEALSPTLKEAMDKGVKVVTFDSDANPSLDVRLSYIGTNNAKGGTMAANFIADKLDGEGKVVLITGPVGSQTHNYRKNGFKEGLKGTDLELIAEQPAGSERAKAMTVMENLLTAHQDIDAVFATSSLMVLGATEAIEAAGKEDEILIVGFDTIPESVKAVKNSRVDALVAQYPSLMGKYASIVLEEALNGNPIPVRIDTGTGLCTPETWENYKQWLED